MNAVEFERVFLPDIFRFFNLAAVTYALDKAYAKESVPKNKQEAVVAAFSHCITNYHDQGYTLDNGYTSAIDTLDDKQRDFVMQELDWRVEYMVNRYFKIKGLSVPEELEEVILTGEHSKE